MEKNLYKHIYLDYLRVLATISVVIVHVAAPLLLLYGQTSNFNWSIGNFYESIIRWCVPVFFMISGALLLSNKQSSILFFYKKRFTKILIPFLFWSLIYFVAKSVFDHENLSVSNFFTKLLDDNIYYHLWFVYDLVIIYLLTPFIKGIINKVTKKILLVIIIFLFIYTILFDFLNYFSDYNFILRNPITGYIGYFILGYFLHNHLIKKYLNNLFYILGVFGICFTFIGSSFLTSNLGEYSEFFYGYSTPNILFASIGIFIFVKSKFLNKMTNIELSPFTELINKTSFGIYLIHPLIIVILSKITNLNISLPVLGIPIISLVVLILSISIITLMKKIPIVKKLI